MSEYRPGCHFLMDPATQAILDEHHKHLIDLIFFKRLEHRPWHTKLVNGIKAAETPATAGCKLADISKTDVEHQYRVEFYVDEAALKRGDLKHTDTITV